MLQRRRGISLVLLQIETPGVYSDLFSLSASVLWPYACLISAHGRQHTLAHVPVYLCTCLSVFSFAVKRATSSSLGPSVVRSILSIYLPVSLLFFFLLGASQHAFTTLVYLPGHLIPFPLLSPHLLRGILFQEAWRGPGRSPY